MADGDKWDKPVLLYPSPAKYTNPDVPRLISAAFDEAQNCLKTKAYTATAIMARKTLEGICADMKVQDRSLVKSLKNLKDKDLIDERLLEWANELRLSGNEAAHDVQVTISEADAKDILDLTAAILDYLYSFKNKFESFKARRNKKKK